MFGDTGLLMAGAKEHGRLRWAGSIQLPVVQYLIRKDERIVICRGRSSNSTSLMDRWPLIENSPENRHALCLLCAGYIRCSGAEARDRVLLRVHHGSHRGVIGAPFRGPKTLASEYACQCHPGELPRIGGCTPVRLANARGSCDIGTNESNYPGPLSSLAGKPCQGCGAPAE